MDRIDIMIIGQLSQDINTDYNGRKESVIGGAVLCSGFAAAASGARVAVLAKGNRQVADPVKAFEKKPEIAVFPVDSERCTSISNTYLTADRERRICRAISHIDAYKPEDIPDLPVSVYHIAGLMYGDIGEDVIAEAARRGRLAVDVQCLLRRDEGGEMLFRDWDKKREMLPLIDFLKTDAAEAETLTGLKDRYEAAKLLHRWGAKEVMITHHTEVIVYDGREFYRAPLKPRNLSGRTGRGDTTFAGYLAMRLHEDIAASVLYAAALVSLKMETPGPFMGTKEDVERYIRDFYREEK